MIPWAVIIQGLAISLALTLSFEMAFAFLWGVRGRHDMTLVVLVNVLTNPIVVSVCYFVLLRRLAVNYGLITLILEALAVAAEGLLYSKHARSISRPWLFSLSVNSFSFAAGELINKIRTVN